MASDRILTIEIANETIKICEVSQSKKQITVYYALELKTPDGSVGDGVILNEEALETLIRYSLNEAKIKNKNVIFTVNSSRIASKEVTLPYVKPKMLRQVIQTNANEYFPMQMEGYLLGHSILEQNKKSIRLLVLAAPNDMIRSYYSLAEKLGMNVVSMDYTGNSSLQLIRTQIEDKVSIIIQLGADATVVSIMQGVLLLFQRTVPYGKSVVVAAIMEYRGLSESAAEEILQKEKLLHETFDGDEVTESLRYLVNNIQRIIDFYISRNKEKMIELAYVLGEGSNMKGFQELLSNELHIPMENIGKISTLKGVTVKEYLALNGTKLHTYMNNIGAVIAPVGFMPVEVEAKVERAGQRYTYKILLMLAVLAAVALIVPQYSKYLSVKGELDSINADIARIEDIQKIEQEYTQAMAKYVDLQGFTALTENPDEQICELIVLLEQNMPTGLSAASLNIMNGEVIMSCKASSKEAAAELISRLKKADGIDASSVFTGGLSEVQTEGGLVEVTFSIRFFFTGIAKGEAS